jgi:hypothetical protein
MPRTNILDPPPIMVDPLERALERALMHYSRRTGMTFEDTVSLLAAGRLQTVAGSVPLTVVARATH